MPDHSAGIMIASSEGSPFGLHAWKAFRDGEPASTYGGRSARVSRTCVILGSLRRPLPEGIGQGETLAARQGSLRTASSGPSSVLRSLRVALDALGR
jgi:hypothetical protein